MLKYKVSFIKLPFNLKEKKQSPIGKNCSAIRLISYQNITTSGINTIEVFSELCRKYPEKIGVLIKIKFVKWYS